MQPLMQTIFWLGRLVVVDRSRLDVGDAKGRWREMRRDAIDQTCSMLGFLYLGRKHARTIWLVQMFFSYIYFDLFVYLPGFI